MRIGIIFGELSGNGEILCARGHKVYDHINKARLTPVRIFCDNLGHSLLLNWGNIDRGTTCDGQACSVNRVFKQSSIEIH